MGNNRRVIVQEGLSIAVAFKLKVLPVEALVSTKLLREKRGMGVFNKSQVKIF